MRIKNIDLGYISGDFKLGLKDYSSLFCGGIPLKDLLVNNSYEKDIMSGRTPSKFTPNYWNGEYEFLTMEDIDKTVFIIKDECENKITDTAISECNNLCLVPKGSLLISNAMTVGLSTVSERELYINQNMFFVDIDKSKYDVKFLSWYFNTIIRPLFSSTYSSKYLSKRELSKIHVPNIDLTDQIEFMKKIVHVEQEMKEIIRSQVDSAEIVNEVFSKEFGFSKNLFNEFGKGMTFGTQKASSFGLRTTKANISDIARYNTQRLSARANNNITKQLNSIISSMDVIQVKDLLLENIHRGKSPVYSKDGVPVVKTAHLKSGEIIISEEEFVTRDYFERNEKGQLKQGDILLSSTGKPSIGKIDLNDNEQDLFADGHISIIRIDSNKYDKEFFVLWFRCILGFYQIERDYVGCTNQIEVYESEIKKWFVPVVSKKRQKIIVNEVKQLIKEETEKREALLKLRCTIEETLRKAMTS